MVVSFVIFGCDAGLFFLGRASRFRGASVAMAVTALLCLLIGLKILFRLHPAYEGAVFPLPTLSPLKDILPFVVALLALGLLLARVAARRTRLLAHLAAALVLAGGVRTMLPPLVSRAIGSASVGDARHHCMQFTPQTCAPAACVSALSYLGIASTEAEMAENCLTTSRGTTDYNIYRGMEMALQVAKAPYHATMRELPSEDLARPGTLAVISVDSHSHAICTFGAGRSIIVQDPLHDGPEIWSPRQLAAAYSGVATIIAPD